MNPIARLIEVAILGHRGYESEAGAAEVINRVRPGCLLAPGSFARPRPEATHPSCGERLKVLWRGHYCYRNGSLAVQWGLCVQVVTLFRIPCACCAHNGLPCHRNGNFLVSSRNSSSFVCRTIDKCLSKGRFLAMSFKREASRLRWQKRENLLVKSQAIARQPLINSCLSLSVQLIFIKARRFLEERQINFARPALVLVLKIGRPCHIWRRYAPLMTITRRHFRIAINLISCWWCCCCCFCCLFVCCCCYCCCCCCCKYLVEAHTHVYKGMFVTRW